MPYKDCSSIEHEEHTEPPEAQEYGLVLVF